MIPHLITQTWRSTVLPEAAEKLRETWRRNNPELSYRFFDDAGCAEVVAEIVPHFLDDYLKFPHPVMRADFFRYAIIYRDGGIYADIDMECVRPIHPLLSIAPAVFSVEANLTRARQHELGYARPLQIANCVFAARAGHPFLLEAMERSIELARRCSSIGRNQIEDLTGPRMLTRLFFEKARSDIGVLRQIVLMPPQHYPNLWPLNANIHTRHHFFGSWKARSSGRSISRIWVERDRWPNPFPAGYLDGRVSGLAVREFPQGE